MADAAEKIKISKRDEFLELGFSDIDLYFARFIKERSGGDDSVFAAAALVSRESRSGHVCIDLNRYLDMESLSTPQDAKTWADTLKARGVAGDGSEFTPLVLDAKNRLYLHKYFQCQNRVAQFLSQEPEETFAPNGASLADDLAALFPESHPTGIDRQKLAAAVALGRRLTIISGGPGTGKTTTVCKILALCASQHRKAHGIFPRILLAAPTGKAAARLMESMASASGRLCGLTSEEVMNALPKEASTIHRLLSGLGSSTSTPFEPKATLPCDVLVVDEVSMVDLPLMGRLCDAISPATRVIFMGDRNQLASVEAGAVLGDICFGKRGDAVSPAFGAYIKEVSGIHLPTDGGLSKLADGITTLTHSYRFGKRPGIGAAAKASNRGDAQELCAISGGGFSYVEADETAKALAHLESQVKTHLANYRRTGNPKIQFELLERFRILCAVRKGRLGAYRLNALVEKWLGTGGDLWYPGRPVMVTENDYTLSLFNGDTGITVREKGELMVAFPQESGEMRLIHWARLPAVETVFAMTIHKSQGSEFDHVAVVLPESDVPVLTRELIYTGITRAKEEATLVGAQSLLEKALQRRTWRTSGLRESLWNS